MQAHYPPSLVREMGCTESELRAWLPGASGQRAIRWSEGTAQIDIDGASVTIAWQPLEPRRIALIVLPRLRVRFDARGVDDAQWQRFMRFFDLYTQRGGG